MKKSSTTYFTDKKTESGKSYYYKVRPYKMSGNKKETAGFCTAQKVKLLKTPMITVKDQDARMKINWKKIKGASRYEIYRATSQKGRYEKIATVEDVKSFTDAGRKPNLTYYYKVRAVGSGIDGNTYSSYSKIKW